MRKHATFFLDKYTCSKAGVPSFEQGNLSCSKYSPGVNGASRKMWQMIAKRHTQFLYLCAFLLNCHGGRSLDRSSNFTSFRMASNPRKLMEYNDSFLQCLRFSVDQGRTHHLRLRLVVFSWCIYKMAPRPHAKSRFFLDIGAIYRIRSSV